MDVETFLSEFGHIANAPGGVQKLREMVLQLAVQGKLVEQNPNDEPASKLIQKIQVEKTELIKKGKIKKQKPIPVISVDEQPFDLRKGWEFVRLGDITNKIGSGSTPRGGKSSYVSEGIPFLRSQNIWNNGLKLVDVVHIPIATHERMSNTKVLPKDILLNITGASLGRCALILENFKEANVSQHVTIIRSTDDKIRKYLHLCIMSPYTQKMIWGRQVGMAREGLSKKVLEQFEIPLPPIDEQKRIVAKVDELMALCDRLEAQQQKRSEFTKLFRTAALNALANAQSPQELKRSWNRLQENMGMLFEVPEDAGELKKCILQNAVMGKLVEQNSNDKPGLELIKKIQTEKSELVKKRKIKKQKPLLELVEDEKPFILPKGWEWVRLGQLSLLVTSGSRGWAKYYSQSGPIFIRMGNLSRDSFKMRLDQIQRVAPPKFGEGKRTALESGDLLISITGEVGMLGLIPEGFGEAYINQHTAVFRQSKKMFRQYIPYYCLSPMAQIQFMEPQRGLKNSFRLSDINEMLLPLPPLEEQKRIVAKVTSLMALCDTLEDQLTKARSIAEKLAQSAIAAITGTQLEDKEKMKAPKTELVTKLRLVKSPSFKAQAPLCAILAKHSSELSAKVLWNHSGMEIDAFYRQLKTEMANGWIEEPQKAEMRIVEEKESA